MDTNTIDDNRSVVFTVVIPCYNEVGAIEETIENITRDLQGGGTDHEIIVVDDGSDDGTHELLEKIVPNYPSVRILTHEKNYKSPS